MDIGIIDKFISNSINLIQQSIKTNITKTKVMEKIKTNINKIIKTPDLLKIIYELLHICIDIYYLVYKKITLSAKIKNHNINPYIHKYYGVFVKLQKLLKIGNIKNIYNEIEINKEYFELQSIIKILGEDKLLIIISNKSTKDDHLAFYLIYLFIYIQDYRIQIFNSIEKAFLSSTLSKKLSYYESDITTVDYSSILTSLPKEIEHKANDYYYMLYDIVNKTDTQYNIKDKKRILFSKILIPIIDDFQRIHKHGSIQKNYDEELSDKRGQTIVKKILSDIRNKQDYYSNNPKINKQLFPTVLEDINGVFYDELLELKIFSKLDNNLMINNDNIELYKSLEAIRKSNFINFINNPNVILNYQSNIPIEAIRNISIKYFNKNGLTTRIIINDNIGDIVNFGIKHPSIAYNEIKKITEINNVNKVFKTIEQLILNESFFEKNKFTLYIVQLNDKNINIVNDFINKLFIAYEEIIYSKHLQILHSYKKSFSNIYDMNVNLEILKKNFHYFKKHNPLSSKFEIATYNYFKDKIADEYDEKEDYIPGIHNDIILLPKYKIKQRVASKLIINTFTIDKKIEKDYDNFTTNYTCQHFLSWKEINRKRRNHPNQFNQLLFEFIKKYALLSNNIYICKSCSFNLDISNDVTESFQAGMANILAINLTTERPLEELREYEKFSSSIKNIDKMVEKIASFYKIETYIGSSINSKKNRNEITKEIIDFITIHNNTLRINNFNKRRQREKSAMLDFGIDPELSNYFLFKLENDIFKFSSNDTDKFKRVKINNIFIVIIFCFYIRLSYNIFINVPLNDKYCNYYFYENYSDVIFKDLKILYDFEGNKVPLLKLNNLKFYLFIMACSMSKYNLWYPSSDKTLNADTIKSIIHTFVDLYNTIIQVIMRKKKSYIYEYFAGKIFQVIQTIITKDEYLEFIKKKNLNKIRTDIKNRKIHFIKSQIPSFKLKGTVIDMEYRLSNYKKFNSLKTKNKVSSKILLDKSYYKELIINNASKLLKFYDQFGNKLKTINLQSKKLNLNQSIKYLNLINSKKKIKSNKSTQVLVSKKKISDIELSTLRKTILVLTNLIKSRLGNTIIKNNKILNISEFKYMIDFNHLTIPIKKVMFIDSKLIRNINKFNKNLLTIKINKYIYTFDQKTLNYIGYYEKNKPLVLIKDKSKYLIPYYSIIEKLLYMGISYLQFNYTLEEANKLIINRSNNISFFINNFISQLNLQKNINPKLTNIKLFNKDKNYKYIFKNILDIINNKYIYNYFTENKNITIDHLIDKSKEINSTYYIFINSIIELLQLNISSQTNICEFIIENITRNFNIFNETKYNSQEIKFDLILNSETIIIGDIDTGIGFYGDLNFVEKISEEDKQKDLDKKIDDDYQQEGMDTDQLVEDEEGEDMGDNDVQLGVGEI